jgi:hypothetical protein
MAISRRIIYSSYVSPREDELSEEGYTSQQTISNKMAGKGTVVINQEQAHDGWVSFLQPYQLWQGATHSTDQWESQASVWDEGDLRITNGSATRLRLDTVNINFLYIKNTGTNEATLALEGDEYDILIPVGAAVSMRVNDISSANIKVDTRSGTTTIEYIIAKTP